MAITRLNNNSITSITALPSGVVANTPAFRVNNTGGDQQISNQTLTRISYTNKLHDTDNAFDLSSNTFTVPSGKAGKYFFHVSGALNTGTDFEGNELHIRVNGNATLVTRVRNEYYDSMSAEVVINLSVGDVVDAAVTHSFGSTLAWRNATNENTFGGFKLIE